MPLPRDRSIVLVGLSGVGKSTVGRRLATRLGLDFVDADREIERAEGRDIADIFASLGEPHFRDRERRVVAALINGAPRVIATGGGAFVDAETRRLILDKCVAIWIEADVQLLAERVGTAADRPMLAPDPASRLAALAAQRNPVYAEAHVRVRSSRAPPDALVDRIVAAVAEAHG